MSEIIIPKFSKNECNKLDRLYRYAISKSEMKRFNYMHRQRKIKAMADKIDATKFSPLGEQLAVIDAHTYLRWEMAHPGCFNNEQFIREFVRDNPECKGKRIKSKYI